MAPPKTPNVPRGTIKGTAAHDLIKFTIRAAPLPQDILHFILDHIVILKRLQQGHKTDDIISTEDTSNIEDQENYNIHGDIMRKPSVQPDQYWSALQAKCDTIGGEWRDIVERIWSFGPQRAGGCLLIDARKNPSQSSVRRFTFSRHC